MAVSGMGDKALACSGFIYGSASALETKERHKKTGTIAPVL